MARSVLDHIIREIHDRKKILAQAITDGGAKDYAAYQHMCGEIRGLTLAHNLVEDLVRRMESVDDSDEP